MRYNAAFPRLLTYFTAAFLVLTLGFELTGSSAQPEYLSAQIDEMVAPYFSADGPGIAVMVMDDGRVLHLGGYGLADVATGIAIDRHSVFDLASCSKQFTAMAILILVGRGELGLDDEVSRYLPELGDSGVERAVTIRDLLSMRSGLVDYLELCVDETELAAWTNLTVLTRVAAQPLCFRPGSSYEYSNTNYALLALVIERVTGTRYADFLRRNLFEPLGMTDTVLLEGPGQEVPRRARGTG